MFLLTVQWEWRGANAKGDLYTEIPSHFTREPEPSLLNLTTMSCQPCRWWAVAGLG